MTRHRQLFAYLLLLLALTGCGRELASPDRPSSHDTAIDKMSAPVALGRSIYPLQIGNRWTYRGWQQRFAIGPSGDTLIRQMGHWTEIDSLSGIQTIRGVPYVRVDIRELDDSTQTKFVNWLREDASGLYSPSGQRLEYPLHTGAQWPWDDIESARVMSRDRVDLPQGPVQAWKIQVGYLPDTPNLPTHFEWYGDVGHVGTAYHADRRFQDGSEISSDEQIWLVSANLVGSSQ